VNQFVVRDPLYEFGSPKSAAQEPMEQLLGLKTKSGFDRAALVSTIRLLKNLTSAVAANYVKLLPVSRFFESPKEVPITFSATGFADALPSPLMEWFRKKARLLELGMMNGQMVARYPSAKELAPRRGIAIEFGEPGDGGVFPFHLMKMEVLDMDEATGIVHFLNTLPEEPPTAAEFTAWVNQSIHQAARRFYHEVTTQAMLAAQYDAAYLTRSRVTADLLGLEQRASQDIPVHTANAIVSLDVPFAEGADLSTLMRIRQDDGEAFQAFREALEQKLREVQLEQDPERARVKAEHAVHELATVQAAAVARSVGALRKKGLLEGAIALAGLLAAVSTNGLSLLATAHAALSGWKTLEDYRTKVRESPAYFLWKVKKNIKARGPSSSGSG
jgi:hypothetical protein